MSSPQYGAVIASQRPTLYWPLDEVSGTTAYDRSPAPTYHGTYYSAGSPAVLAGLSSAGSPLYDGGKAAAFVAASTQQVRSAWLPFQTNASLSFSAWVYRNGAGDQALIACDTTAPWSGFLSAGGYRFHVQNTPSNFFNDWAVTVPTTTWLHWALTYNDATKVAEPFLNGTSLGAVTLGGGFAAAAATNILIAMSRLGDVSLDGRASHFAAFTRILTISEIRAQVKASYILGTPML